MYNKNGDEAGEAFKTLNGIMSTVESYLKVTGNRTKDATYIGPSTLRLISTADKGLEHIKTEIERFKDVVIVITNDEGKPQQPYTSNNNNKNSKQSNLTKNEEASFSSNLLREANDENHRQEDDAASEEVVSVPESQDPNLDVVDDIVKSKM